MRRDDGYVAYVADVLSRCAPGRTRLRILEWGTGFSTFVFYNAVLSGRASRLVSIDNNAPYAEAFWRLMPPLDGFDRVLRNEIGPTKTSSDVGLHYASHPLSCGHDFDLIYIDGRRRMECAVNAAMVAHPETMIVIDDGLRSRYQVIRCLCEEVATLGHGVIYRIRPEVYAALQPGRVDLMRIFESQKLRAPPSAG